MNGVCDSTTSRIGAEGGAKKAPPTTARPITSNTHSHHTAPRSSLAGIVLALSLATLWGMIIWEVCR